MGTLLELVILLLIAAFVLIYRRNPGENVYKFVAGNATKIYDKYAPYSFKMVREKAIELGQEYTTRQYITQVLLFGGFAVLIGYFTFTVSLYLLYMQLLLFLLFHI